MRRTFASSSLLKGAGVAALLTACDPAIPTEDGSHPLPTSTTGGHSTASSTSGNFGGMGGMGGMPNSTAATMATTAVTVGSSSSTGSGMGGGCSGGEPTVETVGSNVKILLKGTVLVPSGPISGEVLISGNLIACVGADCSAMATGATVIDTHGVISPGLIDAHNHILFDIMDETDWQPPTDPNGMLHAYGNHNQWGSAPGYSEMVDAKQTLNGEIGAGFDLGCELDKFGEMKGLVAGTTSIQASAGTDACFGSISRTIDISSNDLPADKIQTSTLAPTQSSAHNACLNIANDVTDAYVVHIAEGTDTTAHNEFMKLFTISADPGPPPTSAGCLYAPETSIIHGTALNDADFITMGMNQMQIIWSPRSNVFLYGHGTDLTKTTDIQAAMSHGVLVSIAPDWSMGGSQNMLDEMRYADYVDDNRWGNMLSKQKIWEMATINPAKALHVDQYVGSLIVGKRADIAVFVGDQATPFDAILDATPREVSMVFVDGRLLYGDLGLEQAIAPPNSACEALDICCRPKVACVAETSGTAANKLNQSYAQFKGILDQAIVDYDASTQYKADGVTVYHDPATAPKFAPITPLVRCPTP
ncbi:MAG: amidohydrolase family protein [Polyangiaceae bacterium]